jgi:hypothetical protein
MFADKRPLQGFDVSVTVVGDNGPALVGEYESVDLNITNDTEEYQTTNSRMPVYLDGDVKLDGSLKRGFIDLGSALATAFGSSTLQPGTTFRSPRFVISANFNAPDKGFNGRYSLTGCIIDKLSLSASKGKTVVNSDYSFKAEGITEA